MGRKIPAVLAELVRLGLAAASLLSVQAGGDPIIQSLDKKHSAKHA